MAFSESSLWGGTYVLSLNINTSTTYKSASGSASCLISHFASGLFVFLSVLFSSLLPVYYFPFYFETIAGCVVFHVTLHLIHPLSAAFPRDTRWTQRFYLAPFLLCALFSLPLLQRFPLTHFLALSLHLTTISFVGLISLFIAARPFQDARGLKAILSCFSLALCCLFCCRFSFACPSHCFSSVACKGHCNLTDWQVIIVPLTVETLELLTCAG